MEPASIAMQPLQLGLVPVQPLQQVAPELMRHLSVWWKRRKGAAESKRRGRSRCGRGRLEPRPLRLMSLEQVPPDAQEPLGRVPLEPKEPALLEPVLTAAAAGFRAWPCGPAARRRVQVLKGATAHRRACL